MDRIIIILFFIALLYALYKYQQFILNEENSKKKNSNSQIKYNEKKIIDNKQLGEDNERDNSDSEEIYKPDSILESLDSRTLGFLDNQSESKSLIGTEHESRFSNDSLFN